jgi:hypothetical protein
MVRRSSILIILIVCLAAAGAALYLGLTYYGNSPTAYGRVLTQYLKALSAGDEAAALALTAEGFVNELSELRLVPGNFRAYDFGFQGPATSDAATLRFLVIAYEADQEAAWLADAVFRRTGLKTRLTAVRKVSRGKPLID